MQICSNFTNGFVSTTFSEFIEKAVYQILFLNETFFLIKQKKSFIIY